MGSKAIDTGIARVAAWQVALGLLIGLAAWGMGSHTVALSVVAGSGCGVAGTLSYGACLRLLAAATPGRLLRAHLLAQVCKVVVSLTLVVWGLSAGSWIEPLAYIGGFSAAVLAFPLALLANDDRRTQRQSDRKTDRTEHGKSGTSER